MQMMFEFNINDDMDIFEQSEIVWGYKENGLSHIDISKKIGKSRHWITKRLQFQEAWYKITEDGEERRLKQIVKQGIIGYEVIILTGDLPADIRREIINKRPSVSEARVMVREAKKTKEYELFKMEKDLSADDRDFENLIYGLFRRLKSSVESSDMSIQSKNGFSDWYTKATRYIGLGVDIDDRIEWLKWHASKRSNRIMVNIMEYEVKQLELTGHYKDMANSRMFGDFNRIYDGNGNGIPFGLELQGAELKKFHRIVMKAFHPDKNENDDFSNKVTAGINTWWENHN